MKPAAFEYQRAETAAEAAAVLAQLGDEARILAGGQSLAEACEELCISQHTARAQLKTIFAKSGVTRQAELVRLILRSVATLA